jgi:hypothetical protein
VVSPFPLTTQWGPRHQKSGYGSWELPNSAHHRAPSSQQPASSTQQQPPNNKQVYAGTQHLPFPPPTPPWVSVAIVGGFPTLLCYIPCGVLLPSVFLPLFVFVSVDLILAVNFRCHVCRLLRAIFLLLDIPRVFVRSSLLCIDRRVCAGTRLCSLPHPRGTEGGIGDERWRKVRNGTFPPFSPGAPAGALQAL